MENGLSFLFEDFLSTLVVGCIGQQQGDNNNKNNKTTSEG